MCAVSSGLPLPSPNAFTKLKMFLRLLYRLPITSNTASFKTVAANTNNLSRFAPHPHQQQRMLLCSSTPVPVSSHLSSRGRCCRLLVQQQHQLSFSTARSQHMMMSPLHISSGGRAAGSSTPSPQTTLPRRMPLPPPQAAAGGGAGSGGSGSKGKGYSSGGSSDAGSGGGGGGLWESYNRLLQQYPLLVKAITTAVLSAVGNLICQFAVEGKSELDWRRFNTFTALGFVWVAPCLHFWFGTLNRLVTNPGNAGALMRMGLDQLGFAPLFISSMIAILAGLDGKSLEQCVGVVKRDLPDAIHANWALWVPAQFINFRFVPANYQVLFANMVALVWNVYFSFATRPKTA